MNLTRIIFFVIIVLLNDMLYSQSMPVLTIDQCVDATIANSPDFKVLSLEEQIAINGLRISRSSLFPAIGLGANISPSYSESIVKGENVNGYDYDVSTGLTASYGLLVPGRKEMIEISKMKLDSQKIEKLKFYSNKIRDVKLMYLNCIQTNIKTKIVSLTHERYAKIYERFRIEYRAGRIRPVELSSWEVKLDEIGMAKDKANFESEIQRRNLFAIIGIEDVGQVFDESALDNLRTIRLSQEDLLKMASTNSPDLLVAKYFLESTKLDQKRTESARTPTIIVNGSVGYANSITNAEREEDGFYENVALNKENWTFGASVSLSAKMPLYSGGKISSEIDNSELNASKARIEVQNVEIQVKNSIIDLINKLKFLKQQIQIAEKTVKNTEMNMRIVERSFENGLEKQSAVVEASEALLSSQLELVNAKITYQNTISQLASIVGVNEEIICSQ